MTTISLLFCQMIAQVDRGAPVTWHPSSAHILERASDFNFRQLPAPTLRDGSQSTLAILWLRSGSVFPLPPSSVPRLYQSCLLHHRRAAHLPQGHRVHDAMPVPRGGVRSCLQGLRVEWLMLGTALAIDVEELEVYHREIPRLYRRKSYSLSLRLSM